MEKNVYLQEIKVNVLDFRNFFYGKLFTEFVPDRNASILDVGTGQGRNIISLKRFGYSNLSATDMDDFYEYIFKECGISFGKWNVTELSPFKDNQFDVLILCHVIEHIGNIDRMFCEIKRILKPGGLLFLETPDYERSWLSFWNDYTHIRPYNKITLSRIAKAYNLDVVLLKNSQISDRLLSFNSLITNFFSSKYKTVDPSISENKINLSPITIPKSIHLLYKYFSGLFFGGNDMILVGKNSK